MLGQAAQDRVLHRRQFGAQFVVKNRHRDLLGAAQEVARMEAGLDSARVQILRKDAGISGMVTSATILEKYRMLLHKELA